MILKIIRPSAVSALDHFRVAKPEGLFFSHHGDLLFQNWKQGFYPSFGITHQCSESCRRWLSVVNVFCGGFPVWMGWGDFFGARAVRASIRKKSDERLAI
jgi:hypothetical protein